MKKSVIWTALSFVLIIMSVSGQTDIPTCPLEYPQEFYKNPGSVLKVPQNTERIIRVDEVLASSEAQSFVILLRFNFTTSASVNILLPWKAVTTLNFIGCT